MSKDATKIYVLDTNILLHEPLAFLSFQEHDVMIPMTVLEELDHIKDSKKMLPEMMVAFVKENILVSPKMNMRLADRVLKTWTHWPSFNLYDLLMEGQTVFQLKMITVSSMLLRLLTIILNRVIWLLKTLICV